MNETILPGFTTTLVCRCGLKESEWREDETLIGKERRRRRKESEGKRVGRKHEVERMFLFYSASLLSALKVCRRDTQSRNV